MSPQVRSLLFVLGGVLTLLLAALVGCSFVVPGDRCGEEAPWSSGDGYTPDGGGGTDGRLEGPVAVRTCAGHRTERLRSGAMEARLSGH